MSEYQLCECGARPEPHWKFEDLEHWMIFTVTRGLYTPGFVHKKLGRKGDSAEIAYQTYNLWSRCLNSIWHVGGLMDDGEHLRRMIGEHELTAWEDFDESWRRVRAQFDTHPDHERALTHKRLERIRHLECEKGVWQIKPPKKPAATKQRKKGRRRR